MASELSPDSREPADTALLNAAEVAHRLGVKRSTLYAYVSRGLLQRHPASTHRHSLFAADAVERLAGSARHPDQSGALEVVVETRVTALDPGGRLFFRGHDVRELARFRSFEDVAGLLWDGATRQPWELEEPARAALAAIRAALPTDCAPVDLLPVAVAALAVWDPDRADRRPESVRRAGVRMLAGILSLLDGDAPPAGDRSVAHRLWSAVAPGRAVRPAQLTAVNASLILLADHELAASTLAARVAASTWADPYRVVLAGLGPLGGPLHGGAALEVSDLLARAGSPAAARAALQQRLEAGARPGFGHRVYRDRDPRADHLLARLESVSASDDALRRVAWLLHAAEALGLPAPNVDFALAALLAVMELPASTAPVIFSFARITGLLAHALEEYPHRLRFRPRATYTGPAPRQP